MNISLRLVESTSKILKIRRTRKINKTRVSYFQRSYTLMASTPEIRITGKSPEESESILLQIRSKIPTNVRTIVGKETCTSFTSASFVESLYFNELKTVTTGRILLTSFAVDSTQSFFRDYGIISPEVVFVSDYQEEGRGRGFGFFVYVHCPSHILK